jgi:ferritin-like metal-binding protein YciE
MDFALCHRQRRWRLVLAIFRWLLTRSHTEALGRHVKMEDEEMADDKNLSTIQTYVSDMYSLESHIEEALDGQLDKVKDHPKAQAAVRRFHGTVRTQRDTVKAHLESIGGSTTGMLKSAVTSLFGMAAGVVDKVRPEAASKSLRDDYTAFNLAAMGYHMLYGTALMLNDPKTAALAEKHHRAYTDMVQDINQIILSVVAEELRQDGLKLNEKAMDSATETMNQDWRSTSPSPTLGATTPRSTVD